MVVNEDGRIAINSPELKRGNTVEVIVLVNPEEDETEYLLSTEANRLHLREALQQLDDKKNTNTLTRKNYEEGCVCPGSL